jgi:hypothetical protein
MRYAAALNFVKRKYIMNPKSVNHLICGVRQVNGMLQILDAEKNNPSITLGEIHELFESKYGVHPAHQDFAFYNQDQYLISLFAYLCMTKESFFKDLGKIYLKGEKLMISLEDWGIQSLPPFESLGELMRYLRNSVAHGDLKITPELIFEFGGQKKGKPVIFNYKDLEKFCQKLAWWCQTKDINSDGIILPLAAENFTGK